MTTANTDITNIQHTLKRRGFNLGTICESDFMRTADPISNWDSGKPLFLPQACTQQVQQHATHIQQSATLYQAILNKQECDPLLDAAPYKDRIETNFEPLGASVNEGDRQEIETIFFDGLHDDEVVAQDLWLKISWLSFHQDDNSVRFRFSFGVDLAEDVAADKNRQQFAALLAHEVFPESSLITENQDLQQTIAQVIQTKDCQFVERIVYFNAPNGGAYLHHDKERGHAGVVYAQVTGSTFWLALAKQTLVDEIRHFIESCETTKNWPATINKNSRSQLSALTNSQDDSCNLTTELGSFANDTLIHLINETPEFVQYLITQGHGRLLHAGDAMLLPQETDARCCWHTVFNIGDKSGQALSFAIRRS